MYNFSFLKNSIGLIFAEGLIFHENLPKLTEICHTHTPSSVDPEKIEALSNFFLSFCV